MGIRNRLTDETTQATGSQMAIKMVESSIPQCPCVARITGKRFVAAFSGENDFHPLARKARNKIQRYAGRPDYRLVFVPDQLRENTKKLLEVHTDFVMI